ncbi:acetyltransferase [Rhizobium sp. Root1203]|uniref:GNAT family N-acetyltransferase n=1 Tax=Rhizobium sp. Root1203 TaxID=1736427 RepID=UPI00070DB4A3|nr:GNAT family N-acetyltransferase [Rhizobium sp. Root1203]KQV14007.1 acetyltransferase [Rhizobium sp. Root1203]
MVQLLVSYLEQLQPPAGPILSSPLPGMHIARERLEPDDYLSLYRSVGDPLHWDDRLRQPKVELGAFLLRPSTALYILRDEVQPIGLCEFEGVGRQDVELKHFGLTPDSQGKRLGPYLLDWALRAIWARQPRRVWLHTDTNDHPKAKATYERIGFRIFAERIEEFAD